MTIRSIYDVSPSVINPALKYWGDSVRAEPVEAFTYALRQTQGERVILGRVNKLATRLFGIDPLSMKFLDYSYPAKADKLNR